MVCGEAGTTATDDRAMDQDPTDRIIELEKRLLEPYVRRSRDEVGALLANSFAEIGSSGRLYTRSEIIDDLANEAPRHIEASDFVATQFGDSVIRLTYETSTTRGRALRESIWLHTDDGWKIVFHRGTRLT
jgi:hypothetical protein